MRGWGNLRPALTTSSTPRLFEIMIGLFVSDRSVGLRTHVGPKLSKNYRKTPLSKPRTTTDCTDYSVVSSASEFGLGSRQALQLYNHLDRGSRYCSSTTSRPDILSVCQGNVI